MPVWLEIKKYLTDYKRILFGLLSAALTGVVLFMGVNALLARGRLFEPFTVGIVDNDGTPEIRFVFDFFSEAVNLVYMDKSEAEQKLSSGEIPAYVELPENFAADIMSGVNTPFTLYGNDNLPLQLAMSKLLAAGGVAFLSSSQAGIYATMDYAADHGLARDFINRTILYPVNVAFAKKLLEYESLFNTRVLALTGDGDMGKAPAAQYTLSFAVFLFMLSLTSFSRTLRGYTRAVYARCRLAGQSLFKVQCVRLAGLAVVNALWMAPAYATAVVLTQPETGSRFLPAFGAALPGGLVLAVCVSALGLMAAALFKNETAGGLFIFMTALTMLFVSGGLVPLAYLPQSLHVFRYAAIPFWAVTGNNTALGMLAAFTAVFFGVVYLVEFLRMRFPRAL